MHVSREQLAFSSKRLTLRRRCQSLIRTASLSNLLAASSKGWQWRSTSPPRAPWGWRPTPQCWSVSTFRKLCTSQLPTARTPKCRGSTWRAHTWWWPTGLPAPGKRCIWKATTTNQSSWSWRPRQIYPSALATVSDLHKSDAYIKINIETVQTWTIRRDSTMRKCFTKTRPGEWNNKDKQWRMGRLSWGA